MKRDNGITLIKLCVILLTYIIIIWVSIYVLINSHKVSNLEKFVNQMELIQEKVNQIRNEYKAWENYDANEPENFHSYLQYLGYINANSSSNIYLEDFNKIIEQLNNLDSLYWNKNIDTIISNYCYFNPESLSKKLGIDVHLHVIINFYTGNIISKDGIRDVTNSNKIIYRQYDTEIGNKLILENITNDKVFPQIEVLDNNGLSQKVKISLESKDNSDIPNIFEINYFNDENDEIKKNCNQLQDYIYVKEEKSAYFTINKSGKYSFIIKDTNYIEYAKLELDVNLCNSPILPERMTGIYWDVDGKEIEIADTKDPNWYNYSTTDLKMANAKSEDGNYWVWLPRFIYKETEGEIDLNFTFGTSITSTKNEATIGYNVPKAFSDNIKGIWVAKFQANSEKQNKVSIKPGQTLSIESAKNAKINCENFIQDNLKPYSKLISEEEIIAAILYSKSAEIEISNDLVHYAGGAVDEMGYKINTNYSSTNNVYGIYDLVTSENEISRNSDDDDIGRYRPVLIVK